MTKLTNNQKKFLRSKGHSLKPVVMLGQHGLTEGVLAELESSLETHELLKIKVRGDDREDKQRVIDEILKTTRAHLVQVIGNVMVIYRAFEKDPQLILPRK
ncbi:ribosome assembly RNA-binding protein YhbY [Candidatus Thioglobus autotrophicus]|uniref:ribosome assembly RNA-binding protein YhbY n=1 Tax=Candidatus Thioglobus autotrophicus TaxID=1705394 RepID=UPI00299F1D07|nr:ribosome assembly RNA-binding protein YhbY [Candidatus Thioglobus autotrophicus]WPE16599.1 ribosome assembly RNA-binding protein YhbY [Candidatus Thioglobus autotrophicus]WPE18144.1 ribosome assembly RNA-binding protein YhbY [Candidatus Thioglobus autotrophicus]